METSGQRPGEVQLLPRGAHGLRGEVQSAGVPMGGKHEGRIAPVGGKFIKTATRVIGHLENIPKHCWVERESFFNTVPTGAFSGEL